MSDSCSSIDIKIENANIVESNHDSYIFNEFLNETKEIYNILKSWTLENFKPNEKKSDTDLANIISSTPPIQPPMDV